VLRRLATAFANAPTAIITIFLGIPLMWLPLAAHSIVRVIFSLTCLLLQLVFFAENKNSQDLGPLVRFSF
jgi:hypothetical protein